MLGDEAVCQTHGHKLEAYCEKDNELLCLDCVIGQHKAHKISSVAEKVAQDRNILRECMQTMKQGQGELRDTINCL